MLAAVLFSFPVPQRVLDAAGLRCGVGAGYESAQGLKFGQVFQDWETAEVAGTLSFEDGSDWEFDYTEDVAHVEELAQAIGAEPLLLSLQEVHGSARAVTLDAETFVLSDPDDSFGDSESTARADYAERRFDWAYEGDLPRLLRPGAQAMTSDRLVGLQSRSVPGDKARLELRSFDLQTGELRDCHDLVGALPEEALQHRVPAVTGSVQGVGEDRFLVHLTTSDGEATDLGYRHVIALYEAEEERLIWEQESDSTEPSLRVPGAVARTPSGALIRSWLPLPSRIAAPAGQQHDTGDYLDYSLNSRLAAARDGERRQTSLPGSAVPSPALDPDDGSVVWEYASTDEVPQVSVPAVASLGDAGNHIPGAAVMLRAEMIAEDEVHDHRCWSEGLSDCPVSWTMELVDESGDPLWSTDLPVGQSPGAFALWGDVLVRQEDEDWTEEYPDSGERTELTGYDLATGERLWTLESAGAADYLEQAAETDSGWLLFSDTWEEGAPNYRIIEERTGEVRDSGGELALISGVQATEEHLVLHINNGHTVVLRR
ncbi:hypothetical protein GCM10009771_10980 [Nesterenkonia flava]